MSSSPCKTYSSRERRRVLGHRRDEWPPTGARPLDLCIMGVPWETTGAESDKRTFWTFQAPFATICTVLNPPFPRRRWQRWHSHTSEAEARGPWTHQRRVQEGDVTAQDADIQAFKPSKDWRLQDRREGRGIIHTRSARTETAPSTEEEKAACTICLETFLPGEQVVVTPCSHMFHQGCITPWVKGHGNCPVCRSVLCEGRNIVTDNIQGDGEGSEVDLDLLAVMRAMEEAFSRVLPNFMSYH